MGRTEELQDHSGWAIKVALRQWLLASLASTPLLLETHGGEGALWRACYTTLPPGVVIEQDASRCRVLHQQRPGWQVYCGDAVAVLQTYVPRTLAVGLLDCDPHGEPWPTLEAFFGAPRAWLPTLGVVVTDSLRQGVRYHNGRPLAGLAPYVTRYGAQVHRFYLQVCRERLAALVAPAGYQVTAWRGQYGGKILTMTYYACVLERLRRGDDVA